MAEFWVKRGSVVVRQGSIAAPDTLPLRSWPR